MLFAYATAAVEGRVDFTSFDTNSDVRIDQQVLDKNWRTNTINNTEGS